MTHTMHRRGDRDSLKEDYVVLAMSAKGINDQGSAQKLKRVLQIASEHHPVNMGNMTVGNLQRHGIKGVFEQFQDGSIIHAVYADKRDVIACVRELKRANLGMSVVVSGDLDETRDCLREVGIIPHTVQYSLGVFGRTDLLPPEEVLETTTMCGHHLVSPALVRKMLRDLKRKRISLEDAAQTLAKQCQCGVFNPARAMKLLEKMLQSGERSVPEGGRVSSSNHFES